MFNCGFVGGAWSWIGTALWWVVLGLAIVWLLQALGIGGPMGRRALTTPRDGQQPDAALRLLRERYARGEIDAEEFDRRRAGLK